jgi:NADPH:quinone reductase-like Zn-dependent oxidoreductase
LAGALEGFLIHLSAQAWTESNTGDSARPRGVSEYSTSTGRCETSTARSTIISFSSSTRRLIDSGQLIPHVGRVFPLDQAAAAHLLSEQGHGRGRIVLKVR